MTCVNPFCGLKTAKQCTVTISGMKDNPIIINPNCHCALLNGTFNLLYQGTTGGLAGGDPNWNIGLNICDGATDQVLNYSIESSAGQSGQLWHSSLVEWPGPVICQGQYIWYNTGVIGPCDLFSPNEAILQMGTAVTISKPADWTCWWEPGGTPPPTVCPGSGGGGSGVGGVCPDNCCCGGGGAGGGGGGGGGGGRGGNPIVNRSPALARIHSSAGSRVREKSGRGRVLGQNSHEFCYAVCAAFARADE